MDPSIYRRMAEVEDAHWWFAARRAILERVIETLKLPPRAAILEVGCGTGGNLPMLARHGRVFGVESEPLAIDFARKRGCATIDRGWLPLDIPFKPCKFDLCLMTDVLEHLEQEVESLAAIRSRLTAGGALLITVPALPFLWSSHDEAHHHLRRYVKAPLCALVAQAGYRVRYASYFNSMLFAPIAVIRTARRLIGPRQDGRRHDLTMPPAPVNRILKSLFGIERHVIGQRSVPFGVSLLLLAQN
jgi:SAM-dependent methyltransferase